MTEPFSTRRGYGQQDVPATLIEAAPDEFRRGVIHFALDAGLAPTDVRQSLLAQLCAPPEPDLWTHPHFVTQECQRHIAKARWFDVYDIAETLHARIAAVAPAAAVRYTSSLNMVLERAGVAWKLEGGRFEARGSEAFEVLVGAAKSALGSLC